MPDDADRFGRLALLDRRLSEDALALWALLDLDDAQRSFVVEVLPTLLSLTEAAQVEAASVGAGYANAAVVEQGGRGARVRPDAFAGFASDGRNLTDLLAEPLIKTFKATKLGAEPGDALRMGADHLDQLLTTEVQDVGRAAETTVMAGDRAVRGYLRTVEPKACSRCVILAGKFYRFNDGFDRHGRCRCHHQPQTKEVAAQSPRDMFDAMDPAEQERVFTKSGAEAIRLGADPAKVVNARRGMATTVGPSGRRTKARTVLNGQQVYITRAGTKRGQVRLMPESILEVAESRDDAIHLLRVNGFLI